MKEQRSKLAIHLHQTHQTLADFESIFLCLKQHTSSPGLHLFPEMFLTGYPLKDLVLQKSFTKSYINLKRRIDHWCQGLEANDDWAALIGGVEYEFNDQNQMIKIENVIFELRPGFGLKKIYSKRLLPNYDIFDELKYFSPGNENGFYHFKGHHFGLLICEDMWASSFHKMDPCQEMENEIQKSNLDLSAIINLSASPFNHSKKIHRHQRAKLLSGVFGCPFYYVNQVGGEDEVLFDGHSFCVNEDHSITELKSFEEDHRTFFLEKSKKNSRTSSLSQTNTWEQLFAPNLDFSSSPAKLIPLTDWDCEEILNALIFGFQEYARKSHFKKFLVALSGGIDSALVLTILKLGLKNDQSLEAVYMPSIHSSNISTELSEKLCLDLNIPLYKFPIHILHSEIKSSFEQIFHDKFEGLTDENVQSRLRGTLIYTRSNQTGAMVINTSNKSEIAVGYSTQYGDSVGALSLLGDLYKTEVYALANFINKKYNSLIPEGIISRGPSAELRDNQLDQDSLPEYSRLDALLEGILSYGQDKSDFIKLGFNEGEIEKVMNLYLKSEYKRAQFCPILKLKAKSFGFGYRIPINKHFNYLLHS
jgi:NAD+ synthase (glutamine-hydrolysing)